MTVKNNKSTLIIIILLAVIICFFIWPEVSSSGVTVIYGENSVWDLRVLSFENDTYNLRGQVEYISNALLTPEEFSKRESEAVIGYPEEVSQYATSRMRIFLPDGGYYAFTCRSIDFATKLYVNGEWILDVGIPGENKETVVPNTGKIMLTLKPVDGMIEIVQQGSNFVHRQGGGHAGWHISAPELRASLTGDFHESIKLGCFLALFFIYIILFLLLRSYRANLYFALFCLMWFLRTGVTGAKIFTDIFPWMSWTVKFRIEYLSFPVTAVLLISLLDALFPGVLHKQFRYVLYVVSIAIAALFLFADTVFMSYALLWCEAVYIPAIIYIIIRFAMKLRSVSPEQGVFLTGVGIFFLAAVHDMLYYNEVWPFSLGDLSSVSMLLFTFCQAAAVFIATVRVMENVAADNAALKANAIMMERQLILQAGRYNLMMKNMNEAKTARHDLRHRFRVLKGYGASGELNKLNDCLDELAGALPAVSEEYYCQNYAVNSVVNHYISIAKANGVTVDVRLEMPDDAGQVSDMDLCVIMGNMLENAVEACGRMEQGKRYIRTRSHVQGDYLSMFVENSFDGFWRENDGVYLSRKSDEGSDSREGIGLSSIKAICNKYDGLIRIETNENIWRSSAMVRIRKTKYSL